MTSFRRQYVSLGVGACRGGESFAGPRGSDLGI